MTRLTDRWVIVVSAIGMSIGMAIIIFLPEWTLAGGVVGMISAGVFMLSSRLRAEGRKHLDESQGHGQGHGQTQGQRERRE